MEARGSGKAIQISAAGPAPGRRSDGLSGAIRSFRASLPGLLAPTAFKIGGNQYVVALLPDAVTYVLPPGAIQGVASRQAKPGEIITLYGVGFGTVQPDSPAGQIVGQSNQLDSPLQVFFGGVPAAKIPYYGLAPGTQTLFIAVHQ